VTNGSQDAWDQVIEEHMTTEDAGQNFLLAYRRYWASPSTNQNALREYEVAGDVLLATFVDSMENIAHAAEACKAFRRALIRSTKIRRRLLLRRRSGEHDEDAR